MILALFQRALVYEVIASIIVFIIHALWHGEEKIHESIIYGLTVFIVLTIYYVAFHYVYKLGKKSRKMKN